MNLSGVSAIVTGGVSGLGLATAGELVAAGARVTVFDWRQDGEAAAREVGAAFALVDVRHPATIEAGLAQVASAHEPARVVVNCAGIGGGGIRTAGKKGPHPFEMFQSLFDVHVMGTFNVSRLAAAAMLPLAPLAGGERGLIIHTSSVVAQDGPVGMVAYAAAKGAIEAMTLPMARDLGPVGIRVCTVVPGNFATPLAVAMAPEHLDRLAAMAPFPKRLGEPVEFARLVRHLAENQMMNGAVVRIDGGIRMAITQ